MPAWTDGTDQRGLEKIAADKIFNRVRPLHVNARRLAMKPPLAQPTIAAAVPLYGKVHFGKIPREQVDGPNRIVLKDLEFKTSEALKEDISAHLHSYRMRVYDPDLHATVLIKLMDEAATANCSEKDRL